MDLAQETQPVGEVATEVGVELSIVIPCLNEAETLGICIDKARSAMRRLDVVGEIIVGDNGSDDGSVRIAEDRGARVVHVTERGYGSALRGGICAARGRYVLMGDADDSYDFSAIEGFVAELRQGADLVMGNRFRGGIEPGAMPWKHRWIGNPALSFFGRLFFRGTVGDIYCGLRAFRADAFEKMDLRTKGMEFACEMVIKATLLGLKIAEIPITLSPDGRNRAPHLRTWHDGWRTLRFMLLYSPRWLFLIPGCLIMALASIAGLVLAGGGVHIAGVGFNIHTLLVLGFAAVFGYQLIIFALFTKAFAVTEKLHPETHRRYQRFFDLRMEYGIALGAVLGLIGLGILVWSVWGWYSAGFGSLDPLVTMRRLIPAVVLMTIGLQTVFASFFLGILTLKRR